MIKNYLVVSSVIFHALILLSLFWIVPFFSRSVEMGTDQVDKLHNPEVGKVEDVSTLLRDGVPYNGYRININDKILYVTGSGDKKFRVGDEVDLSITEHPYKPLNTLMISILGVSR